MKSAPNVVLVGPMGAGKTTIGKLLAAELGLEFKDADKEIEERSGVDIPWIFDMEGEEGFRDRESAVLEDLCQERNILLSTGGGAVMRPKNRDVLSAHSCVIYLLTSVDEQVRRTGRDKRRPLLQVGDPRETLEKLMSVRDPLYRDVADIVIETDNRSPKAVAQELRDRVMSSL